MLEAFNWLSDKLEKVAGTIWAFVLFLAWCALVPLINVDVANYGISFITALLLFLTIGPARRDRKAVHVKLDDLEKQIDVADSSKAGIESLTEAEIEAKRV